MRIFGVASIWLVGALGVGAGTISSPPVDVSTDTAQLLNPQDKLFFTVSDWGFQVNAAARALPSYPGHITFQFISEPESGTGDFAAWLQSPDGSIMVPFPGTSEWFPGAYQSAAYTGSISVLYGSVDLSPQMAAELFHGNAAVLVLENRGGPVNVGLPPHSLGQDMSVAFSTAGFGVGGVVTDVKYQDPPPPVPEPGYRWILLVLGGVLWIAPQVANRIVRRRIQ
jgi:hypothetical protein